MTVELNSHHKKTLQEIFTHPTSANIEWHDVRSLLEAIADSAEEEHNGKLKLKLGPTVEVLRTPHGKDIDPALVVELRRVLTAAGYTAET